MRDALEQCQKRSLISFINFSVYWTSFLNMDMFTDPRQNISLNIEYYV